MNNLDKYREEAYMLYPLSRMDRENGIRREAHIAARLLSEQAIRTAFKAGEEYGMDRFRCAFEMEYVTKPNEVKYLSTHTPPLINLEALIDGVYDDLVEPALSSANMKQQYITDKIKSL